MASPAAAAAAAEGGQVDVRVDWPSTLSARQRFLIRDSWDALRRHMDARGFGGLQSVKERIGMPDGAALRDDHATSAAGAVDGAADDAGELMTAEEWSALHLADRSNWLTVAYYEHLFTAHPSMRTIFWRFNLYQTIEKVVDLMDPNNDLEKGLRALAERHAGRGISTLHYDCIGTSLVATLERFVQLLRETEDGDDDDGEDDDGGRRPPPSSFGADAVDAWTHAWGVFSSAMKLKGEDNDEATSAIPEVATLRPIAPEEVARHASREDLWMIVEDRVYDLTDFATKHPGGDKILLGAGKDATRLFMKNFHSERAHRMRHRYCIGRLAREESAATSSSAAGGGES